MASIPLLIALLACGGSEPADAPDAETPPAEVEALLEQVAADGGVVLASYAEPLGGHWTLLAALPIDAVEPTFEPLDVPLGSPCAVHPRHVVVEIGARRDRILGGRQEQGA